MLIARYIDIEVYVGSPFRFVVSSTKGLLQRFLDPPSSSAIDDAVQRLIEIGAISKLGLELTPLGQHLSFVPTELRLAKM